MRKQIEFTTGSKIYFKADYKYRLDGPVQVALPVWPPEEIQTEYLMLTRSGILTIADGYCWDGPSGPALDTKNFMRGSLVHDALYQLCRHGHLPPMYRSIADSIMREICRMDGMSFVRRWYAYIGVRWFAWFAADPKSKREIRTAP